MVKYEQSENGYFYKIANNKSIRISKEEFIKKTKVKGGATSASAAGRNNETKYEYILEKVTHFKFFIFSSILISDFNLTKNNNEKCIEFTFKTPIDEYKSIKVTINDDHFYFYKCKPRSNELISKIEIKYYNDFIIYLLDVIFMIIAPDLVDKINIDYKDYIAGRDEGGGVVAAGGGGGGGVVAAGGGGGVVATNNTINNKLLDICGKFKIFKRITLNPTNNGYIINLTIDFFPEASFNNIKIIISETNYSFIWGGDTIAKYTITNIASSINDFDLYLANAILKIILENSENSENSENIEVFRCYPRNNNSTTGKVTVKEILDTIKIFSILTIDSNSNIQHNNGKIIGKKIGFKGYSNLNMIIFLNGIISTNYTDSNYERTFINKDDLINKLASAILEGLTINRTLFDVSLKVN